jgi:hypothetical protein
LAILIAFYLIAVIFIQMKGESFHFPTPVAPAEGPSRIARLLPTPNPPKAEERLEPPLPPPLEVEAKVDPPPSPLVAKREEPLAPPQPASKSNLPVPPPPVSNGEKEKTSAQERVKKAGLLGLLGEKGSAPPLAAGLSSLKEVPPPSAEKGETVTVFPQEKIETLRQKTLVAEEKKLALARVAVIKEDLSQAKIVQGGLERNPEVVSDVVHQNKEGLLVLYNKRLQTNPNVQGHLTLEFVISPQGDVLKCLIVTSSLSDPLFEKEIVEEILRWKFPSYEKETTTVLYPLSFFPAG